MNIVSNIMTMLAPVIINKIASSLGVNQGIAGKAISAIVPAILAGLASKAATSTGAAELASSLSRQDTGMLGNLGSLIGGPGQQSMTDKGNSVLGSLLGGSSTSALSGAVSKFTGLGGGQSTTLMGMLAPIVLGGLAQQQKASNLDAGGLANLLSSQKGNISAAMPSGFSDLLAGSGLLDGLSTPAAKAPPAAAPSAIPRTMPSAVAEDSGIWKYVLPALLAAVVLYFMFGRGGPVIVEKTATTPAATTPAALPGADLSGQVTSAVDNLKSALGGVKDEASARLALPKLQDILAQLDKTKAAAAALPTDARHPLVVMISGAMPGIAEMINRALAIPAVGPVLKPVLDQIAASLGAMSK